jgi:hypothetical protein
MGRQGFAGWSLWMVLAGCGQAREAGREPASEAGTAQNIPASLASGSSPESPGTTPSDASAEAARRWGERWRAASLQEGCPEGLRRDKDGFLMRWETAQTASQQAWMLGAGASLHAAGVRLDWVSPGGLAACLGLQTGDVLSVIAGISLLDAASGVSRLLSRGLRPGRVTAQFFRQGALQRVVLEIGARGAASGL